MNKVTKQEQKSLSIIRKADYSHQTNQAEVIEQNQSKSIGSSQDFIQLNEGKWSNLEHQLFIEALKLFRIRWDDIQKHIRTRDKPAIRSHAQKYFQRLQRLYVN